jgi:hypothetical protein
LIGDGKTQAPGICVLRRCSAALKLCGDPFCAVDIGVLDFVEAIYDRISVSQWRAERDNDTGSNKNAVHWLIILLSGDRPLSESRKLDHRGL